MKKLIIVVLTVFLAALTGCSILKPKDKTPIVTEAPANTRSMDNSVQ